MKKFFLCFLIGQMFLISVIFNKNFYDIYALNNVVSNDLNSFSIDEVCEDNMREVYESITETDGGILAIVKMPSSNDGKQISNVYSNSKKGFSGIKPVSNNKVVNNCDLTIDEFIDSTGIFYTNLSFADLQKLVPNVSLKAVDKQDVGYAQVFKMNILNFVVLIVVSQVILFIYTFLRIKVNSVKKLLGYSAGRMIYDSLKEFLKLESIAAGSTFILHLIYYIIKNNIQVAYFIGLLIAIVVLVLLNIALLYVTQISIKMINISDMIKNKVYSKVWERVLIVTKIVMILLVIASVSVFTSQYKQYKKVNSKIDEFNELSNYYTGSGFSSDEYEKSMNQIELHKKSIVDCVRMYQENKDRLLLADVSLEEFGQLEEELLGMSYKEALASYTENVAMVNINYYKQYMKILDENGVLIDESRLSARTILIPVMYKGNDRIIKSIIKKYDNYVVQAKYYGVKDIKEITGEKNIIYIKNNQETNILTKYNLDDGRRITNSIIYIEDGDLSGEYYLNALGNGDMSMKCNDRGEFTYVLANYGLDKLITESTLLNTLSYDIRYYEFIMEQSIIFAFVFSATLVFIIYVTNQMIMLVNRKKFALRHLMGHSKGKVLKNYIEINVFIIIFGLLIYILKLNWIVYYIFVIIDSIFLFALYRKYIQKHTLEGLKGE